MPSWSASAVTLLGAAAAVQPAVCLEAVVNAVAFEELHGPAYVVDRHAAVQQHFPLVLDVTARACDDAVEPGLQDLLPHLGRGPAGAEEQPVPARPRDDDRVPRSGRNDPAVIDERAVDVEEHRLAPRVAVGQARARLVGGLRPGRLREPCLCW
jgi:hypothetical protein